MVASPALWRRADIAPEVSTFAFSRGAPAPGARKIADEVAEVEAQFLATRRPRTHNRLGVVAFRGLGPISKGNAEIPQAAIRVRGSVAEPTGGHRP